LGPEFIFMLTKDDVTVSDALLRIDEVRHPQVRVIGFKDVGLSFAALRDLAAAIRARGRKVAMEVVSLDEVVELRSTGLAVSLEVDYLLGGTRAEQVTKITRGTGIQYFPFPGRIVGHPSQLHGTITEIVESARHLSEMDGVTGLDLLAYRFNGNVEALMTSVVRAVTVPVIVAGSIDRPARIRALAAAGIWGFTVGGAAFDRRFAPDEKDLAMQIQAIVTARDDARMCALSSSKTQR
jgi:hypothetical protein